MPLHGCVHIVDTQGDPGLKAVREGCRMLVACSP